MDEVPFETLLGEVFTDVVAKEDEIIFYCDGKVKYVLNHQQDCCEKVIIESITGDLADLIGSPILLAEEASNGWNSSENARVMYALMPTEPMQFADESWSWTFYKLATVKGYVDIRWFGTSNGYYSESVNLYVTSS